jgi:hypothetical protein
VTECRFCGCGLDDGDAVVETAAGLAHASCVEADSRPSSKRKRGATQSVTEAVAEIAWRSRTHG